MSKKSIEPKLPIVEDVDALRKALERAWRRNTSADPDGWSAANSAWGQCAVTALIVQDFFGGVLIRSVIAGVSHYWNRLPSGEEADFTRHQFREAPELSPAEVRDREYVLSFHLTQERYRILRQAVIAELTQMSREGPRQSTEESHGRE